MDGLTTTVAALSLWISSHLAVVKADFDEPPNLPEIVFLSQDKLAKKACETNCAIAGWYPTKQIEGKEVLYIVKGLDPVNDLCVKTVLLHELVHFWQDYNNAFDDPNDSPKVKFTKREQQAMILEHIFRGQQYKKYKIENGKDYSPRCCKEIAFGRCVNDPGFWEKRIENKK